MPAKAKRTLRKMRRWLGRLFFFIQYLPFYPERRGYLLMKGKGFIGIQIDSLSCDDFRYALKNGYMPHLARYLRRGWFCLTEIPAGLPSSTTFAQAGILYGYNDNIPAFRFFQKDAKKLVNCNRPESNQFLRDFILRGKEGVLKGGACYSNLLDGDADRAILTAACTYPKPMFQRLGGFRLQLLLLLHPVKFIQTVIAALREFFFEFYDRVIGSSEKMKTARVGFFPFVRVLVSAILTQVQTISSLFEIYLGTPCLYTTYNSYDEMAHHYGPKSKPAMKNLKYLDGRIASLVRMARLYGGREYDIFILSDHGQTDAVPFLKLFGKTLGDAISERMSLARREEEKEEGALSRWNHMIGGSENAESMDRWGSQHERVRYVAKRMEEIKEGKRFPAKSVLSRIGRLMEKILSVETYLEEIYRVDEENGIIVTYSSAMALVYFTRFPRRLTHGEILEHYPDLYAFLSFHPGIGLVITLISPGTLFLKGDEGEGILRKGNLHVLTGKNPLEPYGTDPLSIAQLERFGRFYNNGDMILIGKYDPVAQRIVSFDDQVGAHGAMGGNMGHPFLLSPPHLALTEDRIEDLRDLWKVFASYKAKMDLAATSPEAAARKRPKTLTVS